MECESTKWHSSHPTVCVVLDNRYVVCKLSLISTTVSYKVKGQYQSKVHRLRVSYADSVESSIVYFTIFFRYLTLEICHWWKLILLPIWQTKFRIYTKMNGYRISLSAGSLGWWPFGEVCDVQSILQYMKDICLYNKL